MLLEDFVDSLERHVLGIHELYTDQFSFFIEVEDHLGLHTLAFETFLARSTRQVEVSGLGSSSPIRDLKLWFSHFRFLFTSYAVITPSNSV